MHPYHQTPDWPWHRVLYELAERGMTLAKLSRQVGCVPSSFANTRLRPQPRRQQQIAAVIGLSPMAIWPSRYEPGTGRPLTAKEWRPQPGDKQ